ncbi:MAG: SDR family NAD(P)-dependent oxidoreductase [Sphingobacteriia bacterium]|nr:SDR family NAD(P)-dependent oxidoreductase [Sphingobacteriia bacterium]NCC40110.1 SDR family NAD(P)-dependent oxidoreductase [Gammaproteobacteria bacterium]
MNLSQRHALVTGASSGLGKAVATALAAGGAHVLMVARDPHRGEAARTEIIAASGNPAVDLLCCDLSSQSQIRALAAGVRGRVDALHLLVNNAGTAFPRWGLTPDGVERTLAVNHLAPFLLTNLLLDLLVAGAPARIINVGTRMNTAMDLEDLNWQRRPYRMMQAYGQSKLGNLHFTRELARRIAGSGVTVNAVFPGVFRSNLGGTDGAQGLFWTSVDRLLGWALKTPEQAAERVIHLLTSAEVAGISGQYFGDRVPIKAPAQADDAAANERVWQLSAAMVGLAEESFPRVSGKGLDHR